MFNNIRAFGRYSAQTLLFLLAFVLVCLGGLALFGPDSFLGSYVQGGVIMFLILCAVSGGSLARSVVNIGMVMGATRKSIWGALQLMLLAQAACCLPMQAMMDWGADRWLRGQGGLVLAVPSAVAPLALFLLLWALSITGAWLSVVESTAWRVLGWIGIVFAYFGYVAVCVIHNVLGWLAADTLMWGIAACGLVMGIAASAALYIKCKTVQVTLL